MLNEMLIGRMVCPVCERIIYGPLRGWWCPYCGRDISDDTTVEQSFSNRLTARAENGMPYYIGKFTFRERAYPQDLSLGAIAEILEKLAQYEDIAEQEENSTEEEAINDNEEENG